MRHYLLVDDNVDFAENVAEIIRDAGDEVTIASGGAAALAHVRDTQFDALVTDMRMPVMNGARLVHEIRAIDPGLPAIVVTAYTGDDDLAAARQEGLMAVLPKPLPVARLLALLAVARRQGLVVIVEDDTALADNLSEALRDVGFSSVSASSVSETSRLGPIAPLAALVDWRVPGGPGGEAFRRLEEKMPDVPKLLITAYAHELPVRPDRLFEKPFNTAALLDALIRLHGTQPRV